MIRAQMYENLPPLSQLNWSFKTKSHIEYKSQKHRIFGIQMSQKLCLHYSICT